jgi:hypothetical protein
MASTSRMVLDGERAVAMGLFGEETEVGDLCVIVRERMNSGYGVLTDYSSKRGPLCKSARAGAFLQ